MRFVGIAGDYMILFRRIGVWFSSHLSGKIMLREQRVLMGTSTLLFIANALSGIFINTYLYLASNTDNASTGSLQSVIFYNFYFYLTFIFCMLLLGVFGKRFAQKSYMIAGLLLHVLLYFLLLTLQLGIKDCVFLLGIVGGSGSALFHIAYHNFLTSLTGGKQREHYIVVQGIISALAGIVAPVLAGIAIDYIWVRSGYMVVFTISLVALVMATVISIRLPDAGVKNTRTYFAGVFLLMLHNRRFSGITFGELVRGMRDGILTFLIPMVLFLSTSSATMVGMYLLVCAVFQIISSQFEKSRICIKYHRFFMYLAILICMAAPTLFLWQVQPITVFLYGILTSVTFGMVISGIFRTYQPALAGLPNSDKKALETMTIHEFFLNLGRVVGIAVFLIIPMQPDWIVAAILVLSFLQVLIVVFNDRAASRRSSLR